MKDTNNIEEIVRDLSKAPNTIPKSQLRQALTSYGDRRARAERERIAEDLKKILREAGEYTHSRSEEGGSLSKLEIIIELETLLQSLNQNNDE